MTSAVLLAGLAVCSAAHAAGELDLGASVQPVPQEAKFAVPGYFVWCGAPVKGADGKESDDKIECPALLLNGGEPVALFGATDGCKKNGRISSNVHIPLRAQP